MIGEGGVVGPSDLILPSSTTDSTKKFKITVDDNGLIKTVNTSDNTEVQLAAASSIPTDDHINELINAALGVIENGSY